jgi:hypothetical protein
MQIDKFECVHTALNAVEIDTSKTPVINFSRYLALLFDVDSLSALPALFWFYIPASGVQLFVDF